MYIILTKGIFYERRTFSVSQVKFVCITLPIINLSSYHVYKPSFTAYCIHTYISVIWIVLFCVNRTKIFFLFFFSSVCPDQTRLEILFRFFNSLAYSATGVLSTLLLFQNNRLNYKKEYCTLHPIHQTNYKRNVILYPFILANIIWSFFWECWTELKNRISSHPTTMKDIFFSSVLLLSWGGGGWWWYDVEYHDVSFTSGTIKIITITSFIPWWWFMKLYQNYYDEVTWYFYFFEHLNK